LSQNKFVRYVNTIRFKLALWFGGLIILSSLNTAIILNYAVAFRRPSPGSSPQHFLRQQSQDEQARFINGIPITTDDFIIRIQEERKTLQNRVFWASTMALGFHFVFAFVSSNFVVKKLLAPLKELNTLMGEVNDRVQYTKLEFEGKSEEINELVRNFNEMMQRLEKAFASQKQFVQNVSHEIKTPLTIIKTNLESLLFDDTLTKVELKSALQASIVSINNLNNLTEDLLLLSLLDNKKLNYKRVKLQALIISVIQEQQRLADAKHITIQITGTTTRKVLCNTTLLKRAFANILENSIKYSPESTAIEIAIIDSSSETIVEVRDYGCGIPEEHVLRVFDRFFRSDNSRSRKTGGSGLGLAIAKEVIGLCAGSISINNTEPGTKTTVVLPTSK
jgi:signal transduction histidine kinase